MVSRLALALSLSLVAGASYAQFSYSTGFEAPQYSTTSTGPVINRYTGTPFNTTPGAIVASGQGWFPMFTQANAVDYANGVNSSTIQTTVVRTGTQALQVDGVVGNQPQFGAIRGINLTTTGIIDFSFDMRVTNPSATNTGQWGLSLFDSSGQHIAGVGFFGGLAVAGSGLVTYGLTPGSFVPVGYDNWVNYGLRVNFINKTLSVALNGVAVPSQQNLALRNDVTFTSSTGFYGLGGQAPFVAPYTTTPERGHFDNLRASSAPEPSSLALMLLAGVGVGLARRKKGHA